ncbi:sodium- and chloride-dependent glycine transporter 2-like [Haliotis rubra]|uniref:sodium- and chloride-dependent glycine transporter 2-like n=1 Tax=Haliotis rubra TaxID=36100 RepID=UPI001EE61700|nr:sodium- and chloride-dependent glycine transporter 2-like [Haliotis rubra]
MDALQLEPRDKDEEAGEQSLKMLDESPAVSGISKRPKWSHKADYILSMVGYCVSLVNLWRFPYLCNRNGGGAFLIPFMVCLVLCGLPLFFLEVALGQFAGKSAMHIWGFCPLMKGLGISMTLLSALTLMYYPIVLSWSVYFLVQSCSQVLPWTSCGNWWNTPSCVVTSAQKYHRLLTNDSTVTGDIVLHNITDDGQMRHTTVGTNTTLSHTAAEEFWQYNVLRISDGLDSVGGIQTHLALCLMTGWMIVFLCIIRGIKSAGKVVYVTATLPYLLLIILLIRSLMLPGSDEGLLVYIRADFKKLTEIQVWLEACLQVFYSLGPAWGGLITMASFNKFDNNCLRDAILVTFVSEGTSMFGGLVVFTIIGFMAHEANVPVSEVVSSGPGLGFVTYPEALSRLPVPQLWSFVFSLMLIALMLDTVFATVETVMSAIFDQYPWLRKKRIYLTAGFCVVAYFVGLVVTTRAGMYIFQLIDWYFAFLVLLTTAFLECVCVAWIYGIERFSDDIELMLGRRPPLFFKITWCYVTPLFMMTAFIFTLLQYSPPTYGKYKYPDYAATIGWILACIPVMPVVVVMVTTLYRAEGSLKQRLLQSITPDSTWSPSDPQGRRNYLQIPRERPSLKQTFLASIGLR